MVKYIDHSGHPADHERLHLASGHGQKWFHVRGLGEVIGFYWSLTGSKVHETKISRTKERISTILNMGSFNFSMLRGSHPKVPPACSYLMTIECRQTRDPWAMSEADTWHIIGCYLISWTSLLDDICGLNISESCRGGYLGIWRKKPPRPL